MNNQESRSHKQLGVPGNFDFDLRDHTVNLMWIPSSISQIEKMKSGTKFTALEIGSGGGGVINLFNQYIPEMKAFACDTYVPAVLEGIKKRPRIGFSGCDGCKLCFKDESFDLVLIHDVLEHVQNPEGLLQEVYRVLRKSGLLFMFVPCEGEKLTLVNLYRRIFSFNPKEPHGHIQNFTIKDVISMLRVSKLKIINQAYSFHLLGQLSDILPYLRINQRYRILSYLSQKIAGYISRVAYLESRLLRRFPGLGLEVIALKE